MKKRLAENSISRLVKPEQYFAPSMATKTWERSSSVMAVINSHSKTRTWVLANDMFWTVWRYRFFLNMCPQQKNCITTIIMGASAKYLQRYIKSHSMILDCTAVQSLYTDSIKYPRCISQIQLHCPWIFRFCDVTTLPQCYKFRGEIFILDASSNCFQTKRVCEKLMFFGKYCMCICYYYTTQVWMVSLYFQCKILSGKKLHSHCLWTIIQWKLSFCMP